MSRKATELAAELLHAALRVLSENGGRLPSKEVIEGAGKIAKPQGDECAIYESTGNIKWKAILHLQSIGLVKAGYLQKRKGIWYLTEDGEKALGLSPSELWREMNRRYRAWKAAEGADDPPVEVIQPPETVIEDPGNSRWLATENVEALATDGLVQAIRRLDPYEFQDLVAALLRGMGYYTPFVSPRGKDGGIDVIAYKDPLGTQAPTILCQVKHRPDATAGIADVQRLMGALQPGKSVGLFVTSGSFSSDATLAARTSHAHIELIDRTRLIELWIEHYEDMEEEDRALLRLKTIHVFAG